MSLGHKNDISNSSGYGAMREAFDRFLAQLEKDPSRPRRKSLAGLRFDAGMLPSAESTLEAKRLAESVAADAVASGRIKGFEFKPRREGGPEWIYVTLPSRRAKDA